MRWFKWVLVISTYDRYPLPLIQETLARLQNANR